MLKVAKRGIHPLLGGYFQDKETTKATVFDAWFAAVAEAGRSRDEFECAYQDWCYVAKTREIAKREAERSLMWYVPKAGTSWGPTKPNEQYKTYYGIRDKLTRMTWDEVFENVYMGEPNEVVDKIKWLEEEFGVNQFIGLMGFGGLEHEKVLRSMELFADKVMPAFGRDHRPTKVQSIRLRDVASGAYVC